MVSRCRKVLIGAFHFPDKIPSDIHGTFRQSSLMALNGCHYKVTIYNDRIRRIGHHQRSGTVIINLLIIFVKAVGLYSVIPFNLQGSSVQNKPSRILVKIAVNGERMTVQI